MMEINRKKQWQQGRHGYEIFTVPPMKSTKIEVSDTHKNQISTK